LETARTIDLSANVDAFFEEAVHEAVVSRRVEATKAAEQYLALLLSGYARGDKAGALDQPLTFMLRDALETRGADRFNRLQRIGDGVLYILGFFGVGRCGADRDYVMSVGSAAYGHASAMLDLGGSASGHNVLDELAHKFDRFVEVVSEVSDGALAAGGGSDAGVLKLYERWERTGSERLAEALGSLGVCPVKASGGLH
jgi:hypothetical protein